MHFCSGEQERWAVVFWVAFCELNPAAQEQSTKKKKRKTVVLWTTDFPLPRPAEDLKEVFVCSAVGLHRSESCICRRDSVHWEVGCQFVDARWTSCSNMCIVLVCSDCGMNCHKLCKDQVAFECKKNTRSTNTVDSPTPSSTSIASSTSEGGFFWLRSQQRRSNFHTRCFYFHY